MHSPDGNLVLVFNGEIYNFQELAGRLSQRGWAARTSSDTEVLLEAMQSWGIDEALKRVDGMYAFALYDRSERTVTLVRDRFGEKPLAYAVQNGLLWFASELRAFDVDGGPELMLSSSATSSYFRYGFVPGETSIYAGVHKLAPASMVTFRIADGDRSAGQARGSRGPVRRYWQLPDFVLPERERDPEEAFELLRVSVHARLVSDRPVGAFLSGGIDSSLTCALAAEAISGSLRTFTMTWENEEHDESSRARRVAAALGTVHEEVALSVDDVVSVAERIGEVLDEPHADYSAIGVHLVARAARDHFVVALSGDGGDELFGGYYRHAWLPRVAKIRNRLPAVVRRPVAGILGSVGPVFDSVGRAVPVARRPRLLSDKASKLGRAIGAADSLNAYESVLAIDPAKSGRVHLPPAVIDALRSADRSEQLWGLRVADLTYFLPDDVLAKVDRSTMAVSLESRTPFLHGGLAACALSLSAGELVSGGTGKAPLRRWLSDVLPEADFTGPKSGFGTPIADLLRGPLQQLLSDALRSLATRPASIVGSEALWLRRLESFRAGNDLEAHRLWSAVAFELWASRRSHAIEWVLDA